MIVLYGVLELSRGGCPQLEPETLPWPNRKAEGVTIHARLPLMCSLLIGKLWPRELKGSVTCTSSLNPFWNEAEGE